MYIKLSNALFKKEDFISLVRSGNDIILRLKDGESYINPEGKSFDELQEELLSQLNKPSPDTAQGNSFSDIEKYFTDYVDTTKDVVTETLVKYSPRLFSLIETASKIVKDAASVFEESTKTETESEKKPEPSATTKARVPETNDFSVDAEKNKTKATAKAKDSDRVSSLSDQQIEDFVTENIKNIVNDPLVSQMLGNILNNFGDVDLNAGIDELKKFVVQFIKSKPSSTILNAFYSFFNNMK